MNKQDLIAEAFRNVNNYKRHRALSIIEVSNKDMHRLKCYECMDQLELTLRAIQKLEKEMTLRGE